jgi:plastocyanin
VDIPVRAIAAVLGPLLAAASACNAIFGLDDLEAVPGGGTSGGGHGHGSGGGPCLPLECPSTECLAPVCEENECATVALESGTRCSQGEGKVCNGVGACVECASNADCGSAICDGQTCLPIACTNGEEDGTETDVDCGGGCDPCSPGKSCIAGDDCLSGVCTGQKCQAPTCSDGVQNGSETDVDCGASCPGCEAGENCLTSEDCQSEICDVDTCVVPSCMDGVQNGGETDVDCGGTCAGCDLGKTCVGLDDCKSGICTASVCVLLNECEFSTATDFTGFTAVTIGFTSQVYNPPCFKVKAGTAVTFQGVFVGHDMYGGELIDDVKYPDPSSPFMPATTTGFSKTFTLSTPGNYGFYCAPHALNGMVGAAFVVP